MSHNVCCVDGCSKIKAGGASDESDFRCFIRWYKFPKNKSLQKKWIERVNRPLSEVNAPSMLVCSDHFEDDDFVYRNLLQAELLSCDALAGHQIKLKDDAIPNTDRKSGHLRLGPPKAERALKRCRDIMLTDIENRITPSGKRSCRKLNLKNVDELIWENETIIGRLPSMSAVQRDIKLKKVNELLSGNGNNEGTSPQKITKNFSLKSIDEIISENEVIIGDLKTLSKSTASILQVSSAGIGKTDHCDVGNQSISIKETQFQTPHCQKELSAPRVTTSTKTISLFPPEKEEFIESFDTDHIQNLNVDLNITRLMSEFESMIGDLPATNYTSKRLVSSLPACNSCSVSSASQSVNVKEEPADLSSLDDTKSFSQNKIAGLISDSKAIIEDMPSTCAGMECSSSLESETQNPQHVDKVISTQTVFDPVKKEPVDSNHLCDYESNLNLIQNINKLISENEEIVGKFSENNTELYFKNQPDCKKVTTDPSSKFDPNVLETKWQLTSSKQNPMKVNDSLAVGNFSLRNIDALIAENEVIVGGDLSASSEPKLMHTSIPLPNNSQTFVPSDDVNKVPLKSIHAHDDDDKFGFSDIDYLISQNEAVLGKALCHQIPNESEIISSKTLFPSAQSIVSSGFSRNLETCKPNASSNIRNIDELISENEAIISNLPTARTAPFPTADTSTEISHFPSDSNALNKQSESINKVGVRRNVSIGYIDELISENEAILGRTAL